MLAEAPRREPVAVLPVLALFQQRVDGDDALLRLARLRFHQAGLAAEVYAHTHGDLERALRFAPSHERLPVVHLDRDLDMLRPADRRVVAAFATSFSGRVAGLVVHDKAAMAARQAELVDGMRDLASQLGTSDNGPSVFLEYAAGHELDWFVEVAELLEDLERVSMCIDVGHIGIRQARRHFADGHPSLELASLHPGDARLPDLVDDVQAAVGTALPAVLDVTRSLGRLGKPVHFHLHDGHPLVPGLSDHFSFFMRVPIPFEHDHRTSLPPMYGPAGLAAIASTAVEASGATGPSLTLEIHQAEGRLPLGDAADLFGHWRDLTNAERMNYWLNVLAENAALLDAALRDGGQGMHQAGPA